MISSQQTWTQEQWLQCEPNKHDHQMLRHWLTKGYIHSTQVLLGQKTKPKIERWVRLLNPDNVKKTVYQRKTKRQQIFEILNESWEIGHPL